MGVLAGVYAGRWPDQAIRVIGLLGYSIPVFWLGLMGLLLFYARLDWVPGPGRLDFFYDGLVEPVTGVLLIDSAMAGEWAVFWNAASHIVPPARSDARRVGKECVRPCTPPCAPLPSQNTKQPH